MDLLALPSLLANIRGSVRISLIFDLYLIRSLDYLDPLFDPGRLEGGGSNRNNTLIWFDPIRADLYGLTPRGFNIAFQGVHLNFS